MNPLPKTPLDCGLCGRPWKEEAGSVCGTCREVYHQHCFTANGGCMVGTCRAARRDGRAAARDLVVLGIGRDNCRLCGKRCDAFHAVDCPTCARPYHVYCWVPNAGCLKEVCRTEAARPLLPPAMTRPSLWTLAGLAWAWRRWTGAMAEAVAHAATVVADELSVGLKRRA